jgi:hypothetical protein
VVSVDGRSTATPCVDDHYAQRHDTGEKLYGLVRTVTCSLVSCAARVCIDAFPIPAQTNEMGAFADVFAELERAYGASELYEIVMGDAGNCSLANATLVNAAGRGYMLQVKADSQPTLAREMDRALGRDESEAHHVESERIGGADVTRYLWISKEYLWISKELAGFGAWTHLWTVLRVRRVVRRDTGEVTTGDRWFVSNVPINRFTHQQWLLLVRRRWAVENECHNTWDRLMREDERRWVLDPQGMVVVMLLLRRLAFNMLALFRTVTQRSDDRRAIPWRDLMFGVSLALLTATRETFAGLRPRRAAVPEV